ncbi:MAG TPA: IclR family transcriptional regulator C-terminal domain-containing protein [Alicycliphilus sp.]|nr:IclR family transcriptional regulator C-terminal domain-containing protein [Alicycliphilus sp.]
MVSRPSSTKSASGEASVLKRVATILDLMTEEASSITVSDVEAALQVSPATAYRYLSELCDAGLLHRVSGTYSPGPKVLELEYLIRKFDPILRVTGELMTELSANTGCHVLLSRLYGQGLVNVFYAKAPALPDIPFIPGRRLPFFRGSQSRAVLPWMDRRKLKRIYEMHPDDPWRNRIGETWEQFAAANTAVKRAGYYISRNELAEGATGIAAPVFDEANEPIGALTLTYSSSKPPWMGEELLIGIVTKNAELVSQRVAAHSAPPIGLHEV